jgi:4-oxalocrotonate tautomerase
MANADCIGYESEDSMPLIQVTMLKGRTLDQKRKLADRLTQVMVEKAKAAREAVVITFIEITREDYSNAGVLLADRK